MNLLKEISELLLKLFIFCTLVEFANEVSSSLKSIGAKAQGGVTEILEMLALNCNILLE